MTNENLNRIAGFMWGWPFGACAVLAYLVNPAFIVGVIIMAGGCILFSDGVSEDK